MASELAATVDLVFKGLEVVSIVGGGGYVIFKLGRVTERVENILEAQTREITELKDETKKIGTVMTVIALQDQRLDILDRRYEELRHGEGFVFPLSEKMRGG